MFCTVFFFEFRPESAVSADLGPSRPDSARIGSSRSRIGASRLKKKKPCVMTRRDVAGHMGSSVPRPSPRRTQVRHLWCCVRASQMRHNPVNTKQAENQRPQLPSYGAMKQKMIHRLPTSLTHITPIKL